MTFKPAQRISDLPPYLFAELDRRVSAKKAEGADVISFGVGDPDFATPPHIVEALRAAALDPSTHHYPSYSGMPELRAAIASWMSERFDLYSLDPDTEVLPLWGSKEGVVHLPWAIVDEGDVVLCADPGYPPYDVGTRLVGGRPVPLPLRAPEFLPDFDGVPEEIAARAKLLWLNYPGNPTGATCELRTFEEAVAFCKKHDILLAHDAAYSEITYDGYVAPSVLEVDGAKDVAVELHSFSKTFNMTGWRIGWVAGSPDVIEALGRLKTNLDSGVFNAVQRAAMAGLQEPRDFLQEELRVFARRRDVAVAGLRDAGLNPPTPRGSFYLWVPVPDGESSTSFATKLLDEAAIVVAPGNGYGEFGEGYVRFSLTLADDRVDEGIERIRKLLAS